MSNDDEKAREKPTGNAARVVIILLLAAGVGAAIYLKGTGRPSL